jgi:hypothetical protein
MLSYYKEQEQQVFPIPILQAIAIIAGAYYPNFRRDEQITRSLDDIDVRNFRSNLSCTFCLYGSFTAPIKVVSQATYQDFQALAEEWRKERGSTSSTTKMYACASYHKIIGMGDQATPLILNELRQQPDFWFAALRAINRVDPVPPEARGNLGRMADAWVRWGIDNGYLAPDANT